VPDRGQGTPKNDGRGTKDETKYIRISEEQEAGQQGIRTTGRQGMEMKLNIFY
jgi:hypothetical protein